MQRIEIAFAQSVFLLISSSIIWGNHLERMTAKIRVNNGWVPVTILTNATGAIENAKEAESSAAIVID